MVNEMGANLGDLVQSQQSQRTLGDIFPPARVLVEEFFGTYIGVAGSRNLVELSRCSQIVDKHILLW